MIYTLIFVGLIVFAVFFIVGMYNQLVTLRNRFKNAFSQIDVQLKRRYDLIPNLVETAKAYMKHEKETLENVIRNRNMALTAQQQLGGNPANTQAMNSLMGAESVLAQSLSKLLMLTESYPDLKANENMRQLTEELSSTENRIAFARQAYNDSVMVYNTSRETFPNNVIANSFGFTEARLFNVENAVEREAPKVSFG